MLDQDFQISFTTNPMTRVVFRAVLSLALLMLAVSAHHSGPKMSFFNYSGMQATISCEDHSSQILEAGETYFFPLTRSDQACIVTLKDGDHASASINKLFPSSSDNGQSVSVDINDTFLFFAVDNTPLHEYVNFHDTHNEQIRDESSFDLLLWSMENASDD